MAHVLIDVGQGWQVHVLWLPAELIGLAIKPPGELGLVVELDDANAERIEQALANARAGRSATG